VVKMSHQKKLLVTSVGLVRSGPRWARGLGATAALLPGPLCWAAAPPEALTLHLAASAAARLVLALFDVKSAPAPPVSPMSSQKSRNLVWDRD
jgi:hypothetical protein